MYNKIQRTFPRNLTKGRKTMKKKITAALAASKNDITLIIAIAAVVCAVIAVGFSVFVVVKNKRSK